MATGGTDTDTLSDQTFDFRCNVCKRRGKNTEAKKYCTDCQDYYCLTCVKVHDDVALLSVHKIVDKGMFHKGSAKKLPVVPTERCDEHSLKPVDMYCPNHDQIGCSTCMATGHRLCKEIFYIPDYVQNMASACNPQNIQKILASTEETLKVTVQHCEQEKQNMLKRKAKSIQNVRQERKEIDQRLDELEQASVAEIENKYEEMISNIEEEINASRDARSNVVSAQDKLTAAGNNISQIFVSAKMGQSVALEAEGILHKQKIACFFEYISFSTNTKLKTMLEKLEYLGKVTSQLLLKRMKTYPVEDQSDSFCCKIISSCILEDGTIILADHNNNKLKRLDRTTYRVRDHYNLHGCPWQVCVVNNQEVAVSYEEKEIMFISTGNQMIQKSLTETDFDCYALAYANNNLYISDQTTSVYIYSVSGQKLKQLTVTGLVRKLYFDLMSNNLIIRGLAVNEDGSKIYVASSKRGLIILDNNGKVVQKYDKDVRGVHLTSAGTVLVCGCLPYDDIILQLRPDGELIGKALRGGYNHMTVCCNRQMSKMIVSTEYENDINVFDLV